MLEEKIKSAIINNSDIQERYPDLIINLLNSNLTVSSVGRNALILTCVGIFSRDLLEIPYSIIIEQTRFKETYIFNDTLNVTNGKTFETELHI